MDTVAILLSAVLAALLIVREAKWRRAQERLRERLAEMSARTQQLDERADVELLMSGLAQQLKSPLQGVIGNTELMLAVGGLGPGPTEDLHEIQANAARAVGIVRNLAAFTETSALSRRWQDINELAGRAVEGVRAALEASGVEVELALADRLPLMYVDARRLEKVIGTLLSRHAPRSTAVTLKTRRADPSKGDDRLVIEVDDVSGGNAGEPAWSGDLAACRQIVQAHGGSLEVEHPAAGRFRFHLELPVTAGGADTQASR